MTMGSSAMAVPDRQHPHRSRIAGVIVFLLSAIASGVLVWQVEQNSRAYDRARAARFATAPVDSIVHAPERAGPLALAHPDGEGPAHALWHMQPRSEYRQTIARASNTPPTDPIVPSVQAPHASGMLDVASGWAPPFRHTVMALLALAGSLLLGYLVWLLLALKSHRHLHEARVGAEQALRDSRERLQRLFDSMAGAVYETDSAGRCTFVNRAFLRMLGYQDAQDVLGKSAHVLFHHTCQDGSPYPENACKLRRVYLSGQAVNVSDEVFWRKDGTSIPVEYWSNPIVVGDVTVGAITTFVDISERKEADAQLRLAAKVYEQSGEGIIITDAQRKLVMVNQAFTAISGYSEAEVLGRNPGLLASGRHDKAFFAAMWETIATQGRWQGEVWNRRKDGSLYPEMLSIIQVRDAKGEVSHYIGISSDITQFKAAQKHIQRLAHFDPLTGLPNRALLGDRINHELNAAQRNGTQIALMFADLDHFKNINDTLGHRIGDELLIIIANRLTNAVRDVDTVSRQGGDEFILILPDTDSDGAAHVAEKLLETVAQSCQIEGFEMGVTLSIGIAMYPGDGEDFEALSKCADAAMYRAKHDGRNTYRFFTTEMQARSARSLQMENALRRALERNQLSLHYQPQISLHDGHLIGVEALLRWEHPEIGTVTPAEFIPIAEESGQILPIGEWAMRHAVRQMKAWVDGGLAPMAMAVNLSAVQFRHPRLPERVSEILDEAGLPPQYLELELTESVAMDDAPAAIAVMNNLHARGVRMSIDDFGTGYSSLSYLKRFKVHRLKIDQSFVRGIVEDPEDRAIVSAIISLAESLGLLTIAEGVETEGQLAFLREQGCKEAQGYYFSKPLEASRFEAFARATYPAAWSG